MNRLIILTIPFIFIYCTNSNLPEKESLKGSYLGQTPPSDLAEVFAPGFINTGMPTRDVAMTPDGKEFYFSVEIGNFNYSTILVTKEINGIWTEPEVMEYMDDPEVMNIEPAISPDGNKFFFMSNRIDSLAGDTAPTDEDIWVMDRVDDKWDKPYNIGAPINSSSPEFFPSTTISGNLYFTRADTATGIEYIYRSKYIDDKYQEVEKLSEQVNSGRTQFNAYIARDESYIIVPVFGRDDAFGGTDYYIAFRDSNDQWSEPINMGYPVSSESRFEWSAYVSPDENYLFFMSTREKDPADSPKTLTFDILKGIYNSANNGNVNIYWTSADIIEKLRKQAY